LLLVVFAVLMAFFLWARLPSAKLLGVVTNNVNGQPFQITNGGFLLKLTANLQVYNPNFVGGSFDYIRGKAYNPALKTVPFGSGEQVGISVPAKSTSDISFPLTLNYSQQNDVNSAILSDLANRCGIFGNPKTRIEILFSVDSSFRVVAVPVVLPTISSSVSIDCPAEVQYPL
jgi:LEA14-like dessication related protein